MEKEKMLDMFHKMENVLCSCKLFDLKEKTILSCLTDISNQYLENESQTSISIFSSKLIVVYNQNETIEKTFL